MSIAGHLAASYLLAKSATLIGYSPTNTEIILVITGGTFLDLDYIFGWVTKHKGEIHHNFLTHTPLAVLLFWSLLAATLLGAFSTQLKILLLFSLLLHLALDNLNYWFFKVGLQKTSPFPQINWGYPLTKFSDKLPRPENGKEALVQYLIKSKVVILIEVLFLIIATIVTV